MDKPAGKIWRNAISYTAGQVSMALFGLVISAVLARYMTKTDFGQFSYLVALATLFLPVLDAGATGLYLRRSSRDRAMIGPHWARTVGLRLYTAPLAAAILTIYFYFADGHIDLSLPLVMLYAVSQSILLSTDVAFRAGERGYAWALRRTLYEVSYFVMTIAALAIFHLTTPIQQYVIAIAAIVLAAGWAVVTVVRTSHLTWQQLRTGLFKPFTREEIRTLWPFALNGILFVFYYRMTAVFIEHLGNSAELADFRVAFVVMTSALYVPRAVIWATSPRLAWHDEQNDKERLYRLLRQSADVNLFISAFITVGGLIYGTKLIGLAFGHKYASLNLLWYLIDLSMGLFFIQQFCTDILTNFHMERHVVRTLAMGIFLLTVLNILLIPQMGAVGAAAARLASGALMVPINLYATAKLMGGSNLHGVSLWRFLVANLLAAALGVALLLLNFWLSLFAFVVAYGGVSYLLGALPARFERLLMDSLRLLKFKR